MDIMQARSTKLYECTQTTSIYASKDKCSEMGRFSTSSRLNSILHVCRYVVLFPWGNAGTRRRVCPFPRREGGWKRGDRPPFKVFGKLPNLPGIRLPASGKMPRFHQTRASSADYIARREPWQMLEPYPSLQKVRLPGWVPEA